MAYEDPTVTAEHHPLPSRDADYIDDDDDQEWVNQAPKGLRVPGVIGVLLLILFAVSGFWGGAMLQKHHDKSTRTTTGTAGTGGFAGAAAGRRAAAAALEAGGTGAGGRTLGTVSDVEGSTVYLTDASGNIVKINLAPSTRITKTTNGAGSDIQLGQTLIVTGTKGTDGSTSAASITIAPAGTSSIGGTGGFGGVGGVGGTGGTGGG